MRRALAVALLAGAAPLAAQEPGPRRRDSALHAVPAIPSGLVGYTFCRNGLAETWVRADLVRSEQLDEVLAHEAVHREQAARFPTCEAWLESVRSARGVVDAEIPAYCAQLRAAVARGGDEAALRRDYALRISAQSGAMENRLDVRQRFERECASERH